MFEEGGAACKNVSGKPPAKNCTELFFLKTFNLKFLLWFIYDIKCGISPIVSVSFHIINFIHNLEQLSQLSQNFVIVPDRDSVTSW